MPNKKLTHETAAMKLCIDSVEPGHISGRVYSQRLVEPMPFEHMTGLLLQLEALMDEQRFPQAFQRIRSFTRQTPQYPEGGAPEGAMSAEAVDEATGEKLTMILRVLTRQNATWQGELDLLDGNGPVLFASDLEFLKLVTEQVAAL